MSRFAVAPGSLLLAAGLVLAGCAGGGPTGEVVSAKVGASLLEAATDSAQRRDHITAVTYYRSLYERSPNDKAVVLGLSRSLRQLMRPREAQGVLRRALQTAPKDPELLIEMAKIQLALGEAMEAVENLTAAEPLKPGAWDVQVALGIAYDRVGLYEEAERRYRRALELSPENAVALNNFGLSLAQANRLDEAIKVLERATHLPEATNQMRQNLALLHAMKGDLAAAERLMRSDLPADVVEHNLGYYRRLQAGGDQVTLRPVLPGDAPAGVAATAATPARQQGVKTESRPDRPIEVARLEPPAAREDAAAKPEPVPAADSGDGERRTAGALAGVAPSGAANGAGTTSGEPARALGKAPELAEAREPSSAADTATEPSAPTAEAVPRSARGAGPPKQAGSVEKAEKPATPEKASGKSAAAARANRLVGLAPASGGDVQLQLGSFAEQQAAERGLGTLRKQFDDVIGWLQLSVASATVNGRGQFYRIVSEKLPSKDAADAVCQRLSERKARCLVTRVPEPNKVGG